MKNLMIGLTLLSSLPSAQAKNLAPVQTIQVADFNFTYKDPTGTGTAKAFSRSFLGDQKLDVTVDRIDQAFRIVASGAESQEFTFSNAPGFLVNAQTMNVSGFNLSLAQKLTASLGLGVFNSAEDNLRLENLLVECSRKTDNSEVLDQLIQGCFEKLSLKAGRFNSAAVDAVVPAALHSILSDVSSVKPNPKAPFQISSLDLRITGGKYNLVTEVRAQISGKVTSSGTASYDQAKGVLALRISEVKFGFLNITSRVFDELKKNESDKLTVKAPFVYYSLR